MQFKKKNHFNSPNRMVRSVHRLDRRFKQSDPGSIPFQPNQPDQTGNATGRRSNRPVRSGFQTIAFYPLTHHTTFFPSLPLPSNFFFFPSFFFLLFLFLSYPFLTSPKNPSNLIATCSTVDTIVGRRHYYQPTTPFHPYHISPFSLTWVSLFSSIFILFLIFVFNFYNIFFLLLLRLFVWANFYYFWVCIYLIGILIVSFELSLDNLGLILNLVF